MVCLGPLSRYGYNRFAFLLFLCAIVSGSLILRGVGIDLLFSPLPLASPNITYKLSLGSGFNKMAAADGDLSIFRYFPFLPSRHLVKG